MAAGFVIQTALPLESQDPFRFANDLIPAAIFLALTLRYAAPWLGAVMLCYAAQFAMRAWYAVLHLPTHSYLHAVLNNIDFTAVVCCLTAGTALAWRRRLVAQRDSQPFAATPRHAGE